jgi:hypothetical protein
MTNTKSNIFSATKDIISGYFERWCDVATLAKLETKLAAQTAIKITIIIYLLGFFLASTWISVLAILFLYFVALHFSWLFSAAMILLLNLFVVSGLILYILGIRRNLYFQATRRQLKSNERSTELQETKP